MNQTKVSRLNKIFLFFSISVFLFTINGCKQKVKQSESPVIIPEAHKPIFLFGFNTDSFEVIQGVIKKNETFSDMLMPYKVTPNDIHILEDSAKNVFSVRKLRSGNSYTILLGKDTSRKALYFIYEENIVNYIVFQLTTPYKVEKRQKQVDTIIKESSGIIVNSLWADMAKSGSSPLLINAMSQIYEWDIDFFRISKNDKFRIIYEELNVEGSSAGIGKIIAAWFEHNNEPYYAFYFTQGSRDDYFDQNGKNLRKMLLKAPLKFSRISSGFSNSRFHPVLHIYRPHHGVDYSAPTGTPVHAVGDGTIIMAGYMGGGGNTVKIRHNSTYTTYYLHLSRFGKGIRSGVHVRQSDVIGYVGSTGLSTGPHLDYRIFKNGTPVNPLTLKLPPVESINDSNLTAFNKVKDFYIKKINAIPFPVIKEE